MHLQPQNPFIVLHYSAVLASRKGLFVCFFFPLTDYQHHPRDVSELHVITSLKLVALRRIRNSHGFRLKPLQIGGLQTMSGESPFLKWYATSLSVASAGAERCDEQLNPCCCGLFLHTHYFIPLQMSMDRRVMNSTLQWNGRIFYLPDTSFPFNSFIWWRVDFRRWVVGASAWLMVGHSRQSEKSENHLSLPRWDGPASCSVKHSPYKQRSKP